LNVLSDVPSGESVAVVKRALANAASTGQTVQYMQMFGYERSGSSLVGAILDAHAHAVVGSEVNVLKLYDELAKQLAEEGKPNELPDAYSGEDWLFGLLLDSAKDCAEAGRLMANYEFHIPDQHMGSLVEEQPNGPTLTLIGDKKPDASTLLFAHNFERGMVALDLLRQALHSKTHPNLKHSVIYLHTMRHPMDLIATKSLRDWWYFNRPSQDTQWDPDLLPNGNATMRPHVLQADTRLTIQSLQMNAKLNYILQHDRGDTTWVDVYAEDLISTPRAVLTQLCRQLSMHCSSQYIDAASSIVMTSPHASRDRIVWPMDILLELKKGLKNNPFVQRYEFFPGF
jgi:hypothetical protein